MKLNGMSLVFIREGRRWHLSWYEIDRTFWTRRAAWWYARRRGYMSVFHSGPS